MTVVCSEKLSHWWQHQMCPKKSAGLRTKWADRVGHTTPGGGGGGGDNRRKASGFHSTGTDASVDGASAVQNRVLSGAWAPFFGDSDLMDLRTDPAVFLKLLLCVSSGQSGLGIAHCSGSLHSDEIRRQGPGCTGHSGNRTKTLSANEESHVAHTVLQLTFIECL